MRNWLLDAGERNWGWLPEDLSTGRRDVAGLGIPDGRGMFEDGSMAIMAVVSVVNVAIHADMRSGAAVSMSIIAQG